jgi:hypothetical protein
MRSTNFKGNAMEDVNREENINIDRINSDTKAFIAEQEEKYRIGKENWPFIHTFQLYVTRDAHEREYNFALSKSNTDERTFLESSIKGLCEEQKRFDQIVRKHKELLHDTGNYGAKIDRAKLQPFYEEVKFHPFAHTNFLFFKNDSYSNFLRIKEGHSVNCSYSILIKDLEARLNRLTTTSLSEDEIRKLIAESATEEEKTRINTKLQWMVELGIIDHLRDNYPAFAGSTNLMSEYVAKIIGEKQRTVQSYLNAHVNDTEPLNDPNKRDALIEKGIKRKRA